MRRLATTIALAFYICSAIAAVDEHEIKSLPGFDGELPTRMWSGLVDVPTVNGSAHTHYWLVENEARNPKAPTVIWQQGGPGGSSLIGLFTEVGPLTLNDLSTRTDAYNRTGIPTPFLNPYSWHTAGANMLFVEHPPPTGFSYCTGQCHWNDTSHAKVYYAFLVKFFSLYPELAQNEFYMTGESYAGVLVPTTALELLKHRTEQNKGTAPWNLGGWALGNACPGNRVFTCTPYSGWIGTKVALDFRFGHGMLSEALYARINKACEGHWGTYEAPPRECADLLEDPVRPVMSVAGDTYEMGGGYFLYDTCDPNDSVLALDPATHRPRGEAGQSRHGTGIEVGATAAATNAAGGDHSYRPDAGLYACGQEKMSTTWLNREDVRAAIHVRTKAESGRDFHFSTGLNYTFTKYSLLDDYKQTLLPNFRVWQYSGDADPCVPYVGTQRWIAELGYNATEPWRPWRVAGQGGGVAGYVEKYGINDFSFVTIRDAGHMSPRYKPAATLHMFKQFLANKPL